MSTWAGRNIKMGELYNGTESISRSTEEKSKAKHTSEARVVGKNSNKLDIFI